jgi:hypothetical protein
MNPLVGPIIPARFFSFSALFQGSIKLVSNAPFGALDFGSGTKMQQCKKQSYCSTEP